MKMIAWKWPAIREQNTNETEINNFSPLMRIKMVPGQKISRHKMQGKKTLPEELAPRNKYLR